MIYAFGDFELDEERWELRENGAPVETPPKALEMLRYLLRNRDRVVAKTELLDALWEGTRVTEASLNNSVSVVRRLLRDDGKRQQLVKTSRSRGYRFVGPVHELSAHRIETRSPSEQTEEPDKKVSGFFARVSTKEQPDGSEELIGREMELAEITECFERARRGSGGLVLVSGDAGIGKTRLLEQLERRALAAPARVVWGWCWEEGGARELWPWIRLLRPLEAAAEEIADSHYRGSAALRAALTRVGRILSDECDSSADLPLVPLFQSEHDQFRFFDSVAVLLQALAESRPVVLVLEDLHAADSATLLLLRFLSRELRMDRVLLVAAYRPDDITLQGHKQKVFRELVGDSTAIELRGLTQAQIEQMAGRYGAVHLTAAQLSALHRVTEGNPLFAQSVLSLLSIDRQRLDGTEIENLQIPPRIGEAIRKRIERMPPETHALLSCAAVLGRQFHVRMLEEVSGLRGKDLVAALEFALTARVVAEVPRATGQYHFVHGLFRQVLYDDLSLAERSRTHRLAAEVLERTLGVVDAASHALLAHHFVKGAIGASSDKGVFYSLEAAKHALASFAYGEAAAHYDNALAFLRFDQTEPRRISELLVALGYARRSAGDYAGAAEAFAQGMVLARSIADALQLSRAALGQVHAHPETGRADEETIRLLEEVIGVLGQLPDAQQRQAQELLAIARSRLSMSLSFTHDRARSDALSREALDLARRVGGPATLSYALHARHWAIWKPATLAERLRLTTEMLELDPLLSDGERLTSARVCQITDLLESGKLPPLEGALRAHRALAESFRDPVAIWNSNVFDTMRLLLEGRFDEAEKRVSDVLREGERLHPVNARAYSFAQMLRLRFEQARLEELEPLLSQAVRSEPDHVSLRSAALGLYAELEWDSHAREQLDFLAHCELSRIVDDWALLPCLANMAAACRFLSDTKTAELVLARLAPHRGQHVVKGPAIVYMGPVDYYLGLVEACVRRWDQACECFERAVDASEHISARPMATRARLELARARLVRDRSNDLELAIEMCAKARSDAAALGMAGVERRAQALLSGLERSASGPPKRASL